MTKLKTSGGNQNCYSIILNGKNYLMLKVQCQIAIMKNSLWGIVSGTEEVPGVKNTDA